MPATAAGYGLTDPFDAERAIDAQAHLMRDLLRSFARPSRFGWSAERYVLGVRESAGGTLPEGSSPRPTIRNR